MKFLVLWRIELSLLSKEMASAVARMSDYGAELERDGTVLQRYHVIGAHGGAWIYDVDSHEQFEFLLARAPVFNFARYEVLALADMSGLAGLAGAEAESTMSSVFEEPWSGRHLLVCHRLRHRRDELGLTQKQVVTRLGRVGVMTTNRALSSLEHGAGLDIAKLPELAHVLDCTVTYLIGLTDDPHSWTPGCGRRIEDVAPRPHANARHDGRRAPASSVRTCRSASAASGSRSATSRASSGSA